MSRTQTGLRPTALVDGLADSEARRTRTAIGELQRNTILDGRYLQQNAPVEGTNKTDYIFLANAAISKLKHGLGRALRGWIICDIIGTGAIAAAGSITRIEVDGTVRADEKTDLWLKPIGYSGLAVYVRLWVF